MENSENINSSKVPENKYREPLLYFGFAAIMTILAIIIKDLNLDFVYPFVQDNETLSNIVLVQMFYLARPPESSIDWTVLVGEVVAVGITFSVKFVLDKFIVFQKKDIELKETTKEISKYFINAIITTLENITVSYLILVYVIEEPIISTIIALSIGYTLKYYLDKKYVFNKDIL